MCSLVRGNFVIYSFLNVSLTLWIIYIYIYTYRLVLLLLQVTQIPIVVQKIERKVPIRVRYKNEVSNASTYYDIITFYCCCFDVWRTGVRRRKKHLLSRLLRNIVIIWYSIQSAENRVLLSVRAWAPSSKSTMTFATLPSVFWAFFSHFLSMQRFVKTGNSTSECDAFVHVSRCFIFREHMTQDLHFHCGNGMEWMILIIIFPCSKSIKWI